MNNIFKVYETNVLNYVKEHIKEIHIFSTNTYGKCEYAYLLLDDNSIIGAYHLKQVEVKFVDYLTSKSGERDTRWLECCYPEISIRDLGNNIIDHGLVKDGTTILKTDLWDLKV